MRREERLRHAEQAIENLRFAISALEEEGASEASIKPYRDNLAQFTALRANGPEPHSHE